jgi:hypothetical protein
MRTQVTAGCGGAMVQTYSLGLQNPRGRISATNPSTWYHNPDTDGFDQDSLNARWWLTTKC